MILISNYYSKIEDNTTSILLYKFAAFCLQFLTVFYFFKGERANQIEKKYKDIAGTLNNIDLFIDYMKKQFPTSYRIENVENDLENINERLVKTNKPWVVFLLSLYFHKNKDWDTAVEYNPLNVEHIHPKKQTKQSGICQENLIYNIGNISLLADNKNKSKSNGTLTEAIFSDSKFKALFFLKKDTLENQITLDTGETEYQFLETDIKERFRKITDFIIEFKIFSKKEIEDFVS